MIDLGTLGGTTSEAYGINDAGHVVGQSATATGETHAFLYDGVGMRDLGTLGGTFSSAAAINSAGDVVGTTTDPAGASRAFLYSGGAIVDLGPGEARGINDGGQVVGAAPRPDGGTFAFLYSGGTFGDVGIATTAGANAINAAGQITGTMGTPSVNHAFLLSGGLTVDLGTHLYASSGEDVNSTGEVVGSTTSADGTASEAFLYSGGVRRDLPTSIHAGSGFVNLRTANAIDDGGRIVGLGDRGSGVWQAYLLTPATGPAVVMIDKPLDPSSSRDAKFEFSSDPGATFECKLNANPYAPCTSPKSYIGLLGDGNFTFYVRATDANGNVGPETRFSWTIDTVAPQAAITQKPSNPSAVATPSFRFSSEAGARHECRLDNDAAGWQVCKSPKSYTVGGGSHTFEVRATDAAGNVGAPASYTWRVDLTAPTVLITSQPGHPTTQTTASFGFSADEPVSFRCQLDAGVSEPCTSPRSYAGLVPGTHTFTVRAVDAAGNAASAGSTWRVESSASILGSYALDETAGTSAADGSGHGRTGQLQGGAGWVPGKAGNAIALDGSSGYVQLPSIGAPQQFTLEAWVKADSTGGDAAIVGSWRWDTGGGPMLWVAGNGRLALTLGRVFDDYLISSSPVTPGVWQHVAATYDGAAARLYVDSVEVASRAFSGSVGATDSWRIGAYGADPTGFFDGAIDDVRLYARALTATEIGQDRAAGASVATTPPPAAPSALAASYALDEASGTGAADGSGNARTAQLRGGASWATGTAGGALALDGTSGYAQIPPLGSFYDQGFTLEAWINAESSKADSAIVGSWRWDANGGPMLWIDGSGRLALTLNRGLENYLLSSAAVTPGTWQHVAASWDGATARLYVNGTEVASRPFSGNPGDSDGWRVGAYGADATGFFDGRIDDVRIYSRALTAAEISSDLSTASTGTPPPAPSGPAASYALDETSGAAAADGSGNNRTAQLLGGASWTTGRLGGALALDGASGYAQLPALGTFYKQAFTLAAWVRKSDARGDVAIAGTWTWDGNGGPMLWIDGSGVLRLALGRGIANYVDSGYVVPAGEWHHVAGTYDGTTARIYVDGTLAATMPFGGNVGDSDTWRIGAYGAGPVGHFGGAIDEVRIHARALSDAEVASLATP